MRSSVPCGSYAFDNITTSSEEKKIQRNHRKMLQVVLGFPLAMPLQIREHRLIMDHQYYLGRTLDALPGYADVSRNPLKPLAALPHLADGVLRTTSDIARLIQENPRPIKPLTER